MDQAIMVFTYPLTNMIRDGPINWLYEGFNIRNMAIRLVFAIS